MPWFRDRNVRGRPPHPDVLTPAEWRVLEHVRAGRSNPEIAVRLGVSVNTVRTHVSSMLAKLEVRDRHALAAWDGEPQEASRAALAQPARGRFALAAPFGWLGHAWREGAVAKVAGGATIVAVSVAAVVVMSQLQGADGGAADTPATETPVVSATATEVPPEPTATPEGTSDAGVDAPPHAPNGRTGDPAIDEIIEALLNDGAAELAQRFAGAEARDWSEPVPNPDPALEEVLATEEWTARLAEADRTLHAVLRGQSGVPSTEIVLAVTEPAAAETESWTFFIQNGTIGDLLLNAGDELARVGDGAGFMYERYLVLPPPDALPLPPPGHALTMRSGDAGVDALLGLLEGRDATGLIAAVAYEQRPCEPGLQPLCAQDNTSGETDALLLKRCGQADMWVSPQVVEARLVEIAAQATSLHAVAEIPDGYQPAAQHLVMLAKQIEPYRWDTAGLFERDGRIVGLSLCYEHIEAMYPPTSFVLAPPADGLEGLETDRTSGIAVIDETLVALRAGDVEALDALADYGEVGCAATQDGIGAPPLCGADEAPGTALEVLPITQCEGGSVRRSDMPENYRLLASDAWRIYSVAEIGPPTAFEGYPPGSLQVVLVNPSEEGPFGRFLGLSFTEQGFGNLQYGCVPSSPDELQIPGRAPVFLLPPPRGPASRLARPGTVLRTGAASRR